MTSFLAWISIPDTKNSPWKSGPIDETSLHMPKVGKFEASSLTRVKLDQLYFQTFPDQQKLS